MAAPSLSTEASRAGKYPAIRFNARERVLLSSVKDYADAVTINTSNLAANCVTFAKLDPSIEVQSATITLSQANITGMYASAVSLLSAPGAGKLIVLDEVEILHTYATAAYTSGGKITIQYASGGTAIAAVAATVVTAASSKNFIVGPNLYQVDASTGSAPVDLTAQANLGLEITNATGAFSGGNAANIVKLRLKYHVVTLLT